MGRSEPDVSKGEAPSRGQAETLDLRWAKALSHPVRVGILRALIDSDLRSVGELAAKLAVTSAAARYHVSRLHKLGFVKRMPDASPHQGRRSTYGLRDRTEAILATEQSDFYPRRRRKRSPQESKDLRALGGMVRAEREQQRVDLADMARRLGIGALYLERIEQGEADPPATLLLRCARALGTSWTALLGELR
jgi:DNA-binding MarR family transcriptional regulator